jgi:uncharacterized Rmd1/YagE family protein
MRCRSYCVSEAYQIDKLGLYLRDKEYEPKFFDDVIHVQLESGADVFCFEYGCLVFWNVEELNELNFIREISSFTYNPNKESLMDLYQYEIGSETNILEEEDQIILSADDSLIKLSFSHGLSQSVKLNAFEKEIAETIELTRYLPRELSEKGKTSLSRKKIAQHMGMLFAQRNFINLHTDLLDTPEFFWKRPRYEPYYEMSINYLDIRTRLDIVNRKLDVIHELYGILSDELKHRHSSFLEMIVVGLILMEVLITLWKGVM